MIVDSYISPYSLIIVLLNTNTNDDILPLKEASQYLKLSEKTFYRLAPEGKLLGFKIGGIWRFK